MNFYACGSNICAYEGDQEDIQLVAPFTKNDSKYGTLTWLGGPMCQGCRKYAGVSPRSIRVIKMYSNIKESQFSEKRREAVEAIQSLLSQVDPNYQADVTSEIINFLGDFGNFISQSF